MTASNCAHCEERMSDYLEGTLSPSERAVMELHLKSCTACAELLACMSEVIEWGKAFPVVEAPAWLPTRILANTPRVARETWLDTLSAVGRWVLEPRTAMGLLTTVLMVGWIGSFIGVSADVSSFVRNPAGAYYRAYDEAVRTFYRAPLVTEIRSQIERFREIS
jgi:anti-sigma factor RsiW